MDWIGKLWYNIKPSNLFARKAEAYKRKIKESIYVQRK